MSPAPTPSAPPLVRTPACVEITRAAGCTRRPGELLEDDPLATEVLTQALQHSDPEIRAAAGSSAA